jgi:hypothetical protein
MVYRGEQDEETAREGDRASGERRIPGSLQEIMRWILKAYSRGVCRSASSRVSERRSNVD